MNASIFILFLTAALGSDHIPAMAGAVLPKTAVFVSPGRIERIKAGIVFLVADTFVRIHHPAAGIPKFSFVADESEERLSVNEIPRRTLAKRLLISHPIRGPDA